MQPNGDNLTAIAISVGGHILIVLLLLFGLRSSGGAQPVAANIIEGALLVTTAVPDTAVPLPVPAEPVDDSAVRLAEEQRAEEERAAAEQRAEEERAAAEQRAEEERRREADRLREQEAAEQRAEQERLAEEARAAEERRQAEEARLEEERRQAEAARVAEEKRKADAERLARERRAEEERERKAAADRARAAQEARRQAEEEAALQAMLADEEARNRAVDSGLQAAYIAKIKQKIERNWSPPPVSGRVSCVLLVRQLRTGDLANVERVDCGGNVPLERSLEAAANRASPFPRPDDMNLFDPNLRIVFESEGN